MDEEGLLQRRRSKAEKEGNLKVLLGVQKKLGDLYYDRKHYDDALEAYQGQLQASECLNDNLSKANAHRMIGEVLAYLGNFKDALKHINLYLQEAQYLKDLIEEQRAYATLGRTYFMEAESYDRDSQKKEEVLKNAKKALSRSIRLCDQLEYKIDRNELMQMRARLLLNLGLVLEHKKEMGKALLLIEKSALMCRDYKLSEDLHRTHLALASHYDKLGDSERALEYMDNAAKVDDGSLKADAKYSKAELLLKLGNWAEARKILYLLYKGGKRPAESVAGLLKRAVLLGRTENQLLLEYDLSKKLKLHETMGDAAVSVKAWHEAIENYKCMLDCAEKTNSPQVAAALTSLAQTLKDAGNFKEAIPYAMRELELCNDSRESCNSALFVARLLIEGESPDNEIRDMFNRAIALAKDAGDFSLEGLVVRDYLEYLRKMNDVDLSEIASLNERLDELPAAAAAAAAAASSQPEYGYDEVGEAESPDIAADIDLDNLSDLEEEELAPARPKFDPKNIARTLKYKMKRNDKGETPLHVACIKGNVRNVEKLLEENHPTQVYDNTGWSPLHEASNHGFVDIVALLVQAGANVNDPGGSLCEGVTPLHDAAANGHTAVVHLLLDRGAQPDLLTGQGDRALDCLEQWRSTADGLTASELREYELARKRLERLTTVKCRNNARASSGRRGRLHALVAEGEDDTVDERLLNAGKRDASSSSSSRAASKPEPISAGEDYKRTIASLQHPGRMQQQQQLRPAAGATPAAPKITAPLIDSEEMLIDDEWLEDDLGIFSKSKREATSSTVGDHCPPQAQVPGAKRKVHKDNSFEREPEIRRTKRPKVHSSANERGAAARPFDVANKSSNGSQVGEDTAPVTDPFQEVEKWPKSAKPRQTNLIERAFVVVKRRESDTPPPVTPPNYPADSLARPPESPRCEEVVYLEVQVDRESFDLKLHSRDMKKTLRALEGMIGKKFGSKAGFEPASIRFTNMDDEVLDSETVIETIKRNGTKLKLQGELVHVDLPPISDRYKKVCSSSNMNPSGAILKSLRSCDDTCNFRLNAHELVNGEDDRELEPLAKCLHYQKDLRDLNLSRMSFHFSGDLLNFAISRLSILDELHLQCCDIGPDCLSLIEKLPPTLRVLDLSYNPLGNRSLNRLDELLRPLERLQTLHLRSCRLTDFPYRYFNNSIIELDISWNFIGGQGAAKMLQRHLISLSLSNTLANVVDNIFNSKVLGFPLENLEFLDLSGVRVTDVEVENISLQLPSLLRINLSNNINVTETALQVLLARNPTMTNIDLSGCSLIDRVPDESLKIVNPRVCNVLVHMVLEVVAAWESLWQQDKPCTKRLADDLVLFRPT